MPSSRGTYAPLSIYGGEMAKIIAKTPNVAPKTTKQKAYRLKKCGHQIGQYLFILLLKLRQKPPNNSNKLLKSRPMLFNCALSLNETLCKNAEIFQRRLKNLGQKQSTLCRRQQNITHKRSSILPPGG
jgi:hypothetical protein